MNTWDYSDKQLFGDFYTDYKVNVALGIRKLGLLYFGEIQKIEPLISTLFGSLLLTMQVCSVLERKKSYGVRF